jgi:hypothetical protein
MTFISWSCNAWSNDEKKPEVKCLQVDMEAVFVASSCFLFFFLTDYLFNNFLELKLASMCGLIKQRKSSLEWMHLVLTYFLRMFLMLNASTVSRALYLDEKYILMKTNRANLKSQELCFPLDFEENAYSCIANDFFRQVVTIFHKEISEAFSRMEISSQQAKFRYCLLFTHMCIQ